MRKLLVVASLVALCQIPVVANAADISFSINVGGPAAVISQPPDFLYPPELGFGVAVGVPYDLFYVDGIYFLNRGHGWYRASFYGDRWIKVMKRELPPGLRRYKLAQIRQFRDRDYVSYRRDRDHYRGQHFRPEGKGREEHHEMKAPVQEEHRDMREQRPEEHREQRPEERGGERGGERRERE